MSGRADLLDLMLAAERRMVECCGPGNYVWLMSGTVRRRLRRLFLSARKKLPAPRRLSRRVHRARRKAEQALARTCVATGGTHTPAPTSAVCAACGISQWRVVRGGGRIA